MLAQSGPVPVPQSQVASSASTQPKSAVHPAGEEVMQDNDLLSKLAKLQSSLRSSGSKDYVIGPMDTLAISVFEVPELARSVQVSNDGKISLPLLGTIQAAGLTAHELELVLAEMLRQKYIKDPQVTVAVSEYKNQPPVLVFGAVSKPGPVEIFGPTTLIELLARVGGFTEDVGRWVTIRHGRVGQGNPNSIGLGENVIPPETKTGVIKEPTNPGTISDKKTELDAVKTTTEPLKDTNEEAQKDVERIEVRGLLSHTDTASKLIVYPGDVVDVAKAGIVYITGDVNRPGGFVLKEMSSISIIRALALAEGIKGTANKSHAKIFRPRDDGTAEEIAVNLNRVLRGKNTDMQLRGGDILFVPESGTKSFFRRSVGGVAQGAISGAGMMIYRY